jgi:hypothetical protein
MPAVQPHGLFAQLPNDIDVMTHPGKGFALEVARSPGACVLSADGCPMVTAKPRFGAQREQNSRLGPYNGHGQHSVDQKNAGRRVNGNRKGQAHLY